MCVAFVLTAEISDRNDFALHTMISEDDLKNQCQIHELTLIHSPEFNGSEFLAGKIHFLGKFGHFFPVFIEFRRNRKAYVSFMYCYGSDEQNGLFQAVDR